MGSVLYRRGWFDEALRNFETAARMDPDNRADNAAVARMGISARAMPTAGRAGRRVFHPRLLLVAFVRRLLRECMGGDLIPLLLGL